MIGFPDQIRATSVDGAIPLDFMDAIFDITDLKSATIWNIIHIKIF